MRRPLSLLVLLLVGAASHAQPSVAVPLDAVEPEYIADLDADHASAVHADPSLAVFAGREDEVQEAWRSLLSALSARLQSEGFEWTEPLRTYHRFYFRPDGTIERVLWGARGLDTEQADAYGRILDAFARQHRFGLSAGQGFAQCSPATLLPPASADAPNG